MIPETHDGLAADLARHLRAASGRLVWENMQMGPAGSPRPDVWSIEPSYTRFHPLAYEVKVSVADFRRDVTAGKWQDYLKFSAGVVFAIPQGLFGKKELPPGCGLISRGDEGWKMLKAPTLQKIGTLPTETWMKLLIDGTRREAERLDGQRHPDVFDEWAARFLIGRRFGEDVAAVLADRANATHFFREKTEQLKATIEGVSLEISRMEKEHRRRMENELSLVGGARADLCDLLDLHPTANVSQIRAAARELARRLDENMEVQNLRRVLGSVQNLLRDSLSVPPILEAG